MNFWSKFLPTYSIQSEGQKMDWILFIATLPIIGAGLVTMNSFTDGPQYFERQIIWVCVAIFFFFGVAKIDFRFMRKTWVSVVLFVGSCAVLSLLFGLGTVTKGARSWFDLGLFSFQPSDIVKLALIILLAKYFSRRHIEIANIRHILVSGVYAGIISLLVLVQPDFGSAIIIFLIWFGMVLVSGLSKKHVALVFLVGAFTFAGLWNFGFAEYQKNRIRNFINPLADIHGSGYNAFQAMVAVGSGQITGKGIGFGTQSRLKFLPEYETDFIFAAFAEEWGLIGVLMLFVSYITLIWRILLNALRGATNFEILFGCGVALLFISHFVINVGMNIGLLPVTGIVLPLMSYGGTHMLMEFTALGMVVAMRRYSRVAHKDVTKNEFLGPQ